MGSELSGHGKGAFTGTGARKIGCFEPSDSPHPLFIDGGGKLPHGLAVTFSRCSSWPGGAIRRVGGRRKNRRQADNLWGPHEKLNIEHRADIGLRNSGFSSPKYRSLRYFRRLLTNHQVWF